MDADGLIRDHYGLAQRLSRRTAAKLPDPRWRDDLVSAGMEAFVASARRWDFAPGVPFPVYLRVRIPGAVIDEWRLLTRTCRPHRPLPLSLDRLRTDAVAEGFEYDVADPDPSPADVLVAREALRCFVRACRSSRDLDVVRAVVAGGPELQDIARAHHVHPSTLTGDLVRLRRSLP